MRQLLIFILLSFSISFCYGQNLFINPGVDTLDAEVKLAIQFYSQYIDEYTHDSLPDFSKYWSKKDCNQYKYPDQMMYAISSSHPTYLLGDKKTILYIKPGKEYIHIKTHVGWVEPDSLKNISTVCITNHYIKFDQNQKPYFINPIDINSKNWKHTALRNVTYFYPPYHTFNPNKADSLIASIQKLEKDWSLQPISIRYYFAETKEEIQQLRGFDFSLDMGNRNKPSGISDDQDNIIYCAGLGENYFHEVVHLYLNKLYPESPLREGLAVFYGGSMGKALTWHLKQLQIHLQQHQEIDLNKLDNFRYMDNYTNPNSIILGFLCLLAFRKDGIKGLKRIMAYSSIEDIFFKRVSYKASSVEFFFKTKHQATVMQPRHRLPF